MSRKAT